MRYIFLLSLVLTLAACSSMSTKELPTAINLSPEKSALTAPAGTNTPAVSNAPTNKQKAESRKISPRAYYFYMLAYTMELEGKNKDAAQLYYAVLKADPDSVHVRVQLVNVLLKLGAIEEAEKNIKRAILHEPENIPALIAFAQVLTKRNNIKGAIETYKKINKLDSSEVTAHLHLAVIYASLKKYNKAYNVLSKLKTDDTETKASGFKYIGIIAMGENDFKHAKRFFDKVLKLDPMREDIYISLGNMSIKEGKNAKAEAYYKKAIKTNPANPLAFESLAQLYLNKRQPQRAIDVIKQLGNLEPDDMGIHKKLGLIYLNMNKYEEAIVALSKVIDANPKEMESRYYLALSLEEVGRISDAIAQYEELRILDASNIKPLLNLGFMYGQLGDNDNAAKVYEQLVEVAGDKPEYYVYLAKIYMSMERKDDAERVLNTATKKFDDNAELHFTVAIMYEGNDNFDMMIKHLKRTIEINPKHADALNFLGYSYAEKGINLNAALSLVKQSLSLKPDNGYITDSLGWVYYQMGDYELALSTIKKASSIVKDDPVILEHLGDVYLAVNDKKAAIKAWERAIALKGKKIEHKERVLEKIKNLRTNN